MAEELKLDFEKLLVEQNGGWAGGTSDWIYSFANSAVRSIPELVGITPDESTIRWRAANPVSGFVSELAGMAVPYAGWLRAARGIKSLERVAAGIEAAKLQRPFTAIAGAEAVRLAPFEIGRTAISQVVGDKPLGEMALEAGLNLTLGSALMGGVGVLGGMGKRAAALKTLAPGIDESLPPQLLLRKIDEAAAAAPLEAQSSFVDFQRKLDEIARGELNERYLSKEVSGKRDRLEALFRPGIDGTGLVEKRRPVTGGTPDTFGSEEAWRGLVSEAGVAPESLSRNAQFPRIITFNQERELAGSMDAALGLVDDAALPMAGRRASVVQNTITRALEPVGDGWWAKREPEGGLFVMGKKIRGEATASPKDSWLLFKTDKPGEFVKNSQGFMNTMVARERWIVGPNRVEKNIVPGELFGELHGMLAKFPYENFSEATAAGNPGRLRKLADKVLPKALKGNEATKVAGEFIREYITPAQRQLTKSTRGLYTYNMGRAIQEGADTFYQKLLQGELKLSGTKGIFSQIINASETAGTRNVQDILTDFDKEKLLPEFMRLLRNGWGSGRAAELTAEGKLSPRTAALAKELEDIDKIQHGQINRFEDAAGKSKTPWREGHYGLPRTWDGDFFQIIRDEAGAVSGVAAGHTKRAAAVKGQELATHMARESGRKFRVAEAFIRNDTGGVPLDARPFLTNPGRTLERQNIRGFKWDLEDPKLNDLLQGYQETFNRSARYLGTNGREALLSRHVAALAVEDSAAYRMVSTRFNQMSGIEGEFSKIQNRLLDKALAPALGSGSATKIVQATNTGMMHLQLGALKLSHPIQNIIGVVQTVAPELAFVMNAPASDVALRYMMSAPAIGARGTLGVMHTLTPMKVMAQALKATARPDKGLTAGLERAVNERVLDARIVEERVGQNRTTLKEWRKALTGGKEFAQFIGAISEYMPAASERFARVMSFNSAWIVGRDILRITDDDHLFRFAKTFTERTNFLYSSADRPLVFTSPLGSSMGLFKNWMMNYMGSMVEYANLGLDKGVWSPLMWQTLSTAAVGGAAATPLYWAAEGASKLFADKHLMQYAYDNYKDQADGIMFGLPAALTGVSLSSLMTAPGANPMKDAAQLFSFAAWDRMKSLGGAGAAAMDHWQATGQHPASDPDVRGMLMKALAPVNLYRVMATQEEGLVRNPMTDLPSARGLSWYDQMLYRSGLAPVTIERQMAASNAIYADKQKMQAQTRAFGDAFAEAMKSGDSRSMDIVLQRALGLGVDISAVMRSATTRVQQSEKTSAERLGGAKAQAKWENVLGVR